MTTRNKRIRKFVAVLGLILLLGLISILSLLTWLSNSGYIKNQLDPQFVPTAQYLIQNPINPPTFIERITPNPSSQIKSSDKICIVNNEQVQLEKSIEVALTAIFLNNQKIPMDGSNVLQKTFSDEMTIGEPSSHGRDLIFCLSFNLSPGYHVFRIQYSRSLMDLVFPIQEYSYEWAYNVSN